MYDIIIITTGIIIIITRSSSLAMVSRSIMHTGKHKKICDIDHRPYDLETQ